jgi:hypothetical protein
VQIELALAREDVTQGSPVDQVAAVEERYAREILEAARDEVKVIADFAHARVGVKAGDDRVGERPQALVAWAAGRCIWDAGSTLAGHALRPLARRRRS